MRHLVAVLVAFLLTACQDGPSLLLATIPEGRVISTYYQVDSSEGRVDCYAKPSNKARIVMTLANKQIVSLASRDTKLIKDGEVFWLFAVPLLSHRPGCYFDTRHLIPLP